MEKKEPVNVIMAVFNEERTLGEVLTRVLAQKIDKLVIIDDKSRDSSLEIIKKFAKKDKRIEYATNTENRGKGYSVRKGLELVKKGIVIIQDADLEYYPEDYPKMIQKVRDDTFVLGTRVHTIQQGYNYIMARSANAVLSSEFNALFNRKLTDINTCYKVFKKEMLDGVVLKEDGFLLDIELLIALVRKGYKGDEVQIRYKGRTYAEGKHITAKDAVDQVFFMISKSAE